jgi:hypothetical protein
MIPQTTIKTISRIINETIRPINQAELVAFGPRSKENQSIKIL